MFETSLNYRMSLSKTKETKVLFCFWEDTP